MKRHDFDQYVVLDLETTGVEAQRDSIIEVAAIKVQGGKTIDSYESLVRFEGELHPIISLITGIQPEPLRDAPLLAEILPKLREFVGDLPIVGHNIPFDIAFLKAAGCEFSNVQWDTSVLASIFLPHAGSHSLESLSKMFGIPHQAHRAMGDVIATGKLWQILMDQMGTHDTKRRDSVARIAAKSSWGMRNIWNISDAKSTGQDIIQKKNRTTSQDFDIDLTQKSLALECLGVEKKDVASYAIRKLLANKKRVLTCAANFFTLESIAQEFPVHAFLDRASSYLDWEKFEARIAGSEIDIVTAIVAAKILLHHDKGDIVHRGDLALIADDFRIFDELCCSEVSSDFANVLARGASSPLVLMTQGALLEWVRKNPDFLSGFDHLIMLDTHMLEGNITRAFGVEIDSASEPMLDDFFAGVSKWISSFLPASTYPESVLLRPDIMKKDFLALADEAKGLGNQNLLRFFEPDNVSIRWMKVFPDGRCILYISPVEVRTILQDKILSKCPHLVIAEKGAFLDELGTFGEYQKLSDEDFLTSLSVHVPDISEISGTKKLGDTEAQQRYFLEKIGEINGPTAFIFSSRRVLQNFVLDMRSKLLEYEIPFIAEGIGGGRGKLLSLYEALKDSKRMVFFCTHRYLPLFEREDLEFQNIFFQSLPFDPPDPVSQVRGSIKRNGFMDYTLPKTVHNMSVLLEKLTLKKIPRNIFFLDRRVVEKDYAKAFLDLLIK